MQPRRQSRYLIQFIFSLINFATMKVMSDDEWIDTPADESDEDSEHEEFDNTFYANLNKDRLHKPVDQWRPCGGFVTMPTS
jgi:hypothetical protein